jgi:hypothetical protein
MMIKSTRYQSAGLVIMATLIVVAIAMAQQRFDSPRPSSKNSMTGEEQVKTNSPVVRKNEDEALVHLLREGRIIAFGRWIEDDGTGEALSYIARAFDQDPKYDEGGGVKLSIFNRAGAVIYEQYFKEIHSIYRTFALRKPTPQLAIEVEYGGNSSGLEMFELMNGKVVSITDAIDNDFRSGAEVRPQFRVGVKPAQEPYQILLTKPSLVDDSEKLTKVYRYDGGKYHYRGEFSQQKIDDYMEKLMSVETANKENQNKTIPK